MGLSAVVVARTRDVLAQLPPAPLGRAAEARRRSLRSQGDRDDFAAARILAARVLSETGVLNEARALNEAGQGDLAPAALRQRCEFCGGEHGRPLPVSGLQVSWSHSGGWVAAGVSPGALGVDVEASAALTEGVALPYEALTPAEKALVARAPDPARAFRLAWTAKEACVKAGAAPLDRIAEFGVLAGPDRLLGASGRLLLSTRAFRGAVASAASETPLAWHTLGDGGALVPLPASDRAVGSRA